jgi:DNA-binding MarR family transcriptional regulator
MSRVLIVQRATHQMAHTLEPTLTELRLSMGEAHVLAHLVRVGQCTVGDLVRDFGHKRSTVTSILNRLEERHLVRRDIHPEDRRSFILRLLPEGLPLGERVLAAMREFEKRVEQRVNARDLQGFDTVMKAIGESP